jgi:hypothetical protein
MAPMAIIRHEFAAPSIAAAKVLRWQTAPARWYWKHWTALANVAQHPLLNSLALE